MKRFTIRTSAFALAMLCCLIAVCLAATTDNVDRIKNAAPAASQTTMQPAIPVDKTKYQIAAAHERYHEIDVDYTIWEVNYTLPLCDDILFTLERVVHMADEFHIVGRFDVVNANCQRMIDSHVVLNDDYVTLRNDTEIKQLITQGYDIYVASAWTIEYRNLIGENGETAIENMDQYTQVMYWTDPNQLYSHSMISVAYSIDVSTLQKCVMDTYLLYAKYELTGDELSYWMESTHENVPLAPQKMNDEPIMALPSPLPAMAPPAPSPIPTLAPDK